MPPDASGASQRGERPLKRKATGGCGSGSADRRQAQRGQFQSFDIGIWIVDNRRAAAGNLRTPGCSTNGER
jgi:hypothetical protein